MCMYLSMHTYIQQWLPSLPFLKNTFVYMCVRAHVYMCVHVCMCVYMCACIHHGMNAEVREQHILLPCRSQGRSSSHEHWQQVPSLPC